MSQLPFAVPAPPRWTFDWHSFNEQFEWIRAMRGCPQEPLFHAEGDVWIHVRMVCEALVALPEWQALPSVDRAILFAAALLHDVAKPACTRTESGRITSRGHSQRGAIQARRILWEHSVNFRAREHVCGLIRFHQSPFHLIEREDAERQAYLISQTARCDLLTILAKADALGRKCADQSDLLDRIALFRELCHEHQCLHQPKAFPSTLSRFEYFQTPGRDLSYRAFDQSKCEVILMSGLPGCGKDTWVFKHAQGLPEISLDRIRAEIGAAPTGEQGEVIQLARERAREFLRQTRPFVWNATNLTRDLRSQLVELFTAYHASVRIVYVESPNTRLWQQNKARAQSVPESAILQMMERWDLPNPTEAPAVEYWENNGTLQLV